MYLYVHPLCHASALLLDFMVVLHWWENCAMLWDDRIFAVCVNRNLSRPSLQPPPPLCFHSVGKCCGYIKGGGHISDSCGHSRVILRLLCEEKGL